MSSILFTAIAMLINALGCVIDKRRSQARKYKLQYILLFTIFAVLTGADSYRKIHKFMEKHLKTLKSVFKLKWKRAPAYATIRYAMTNVDINSLEKAFREHAQEIIKSSKIGKEYWTINLDGKSLRGSQAGIDGHPIQMLMAFLTTERIVLAHLDITEFEKTNEIPKAQDMIEELGLRGIVFTMDALHTQKKLWPWLSGAEILPLLRLRTIRNNS